MEKELEAGSRTTSMVMDMATNDHTSNDATITKKTATSTTNYIDVRVEKLSIEASLMRCFSSYSSTSFPVRLRDSLYQIWGAKWFWIYTVVMFSVSAFISAVDEPFVGILALISMTPIVFISLLMVDYRRFYLLLCHPRGIIPYLLGASFTGLSIRLFWNNNIYALVMINVAAWAAACFISFTEIVDAPKMLVVAVFCFWQICCNTLLRFFVYGTPYRTIDENVTYQIESGGFSTLQFLGFVSCALTILTLVKVYDLTQSRIHHAIYLIPLQGDAVNPSSVEQQYGYFAHRNWDVDAYVFHPARSRRVFFCCLSFFLLNVATFIVNDVAFHRKSYHP